MNCERLEKNLIAYLDGKVSSAARHRFEAHLAGCTACRERVGEFRQVWNVLDELPEEAPSPAFDAALRERIAQEAPRPAFWRWLVPSPRVAIAVAALVVLSLWMNSRPPADQPAQVVPPQNSDAEFMMIKNLPVLEDYDVLSNFDALSELPVQQPEQAQPEM